MRHRERVTIDARPADVWPWVADPRRAVRWNDKVEDVDAPEPAGLRAGTEYWVDYRMRRRLRVRARITEWAPPSTVEVQYEAGDLSRGAGAVERIELEADSGGTRVTRTVVLSDPSIPRPFRWLVWFLLRFGRPVGATSMQRLKATVEGEGGVP